MISDKLKEEIKEELIRKIKNKIANYDFSKKSGNPFIDIVFGKYSNIKSFIHGTATMLGSYYEILARKIAQENSNFIEAKKIVLIGKISNSESAVIKHLVKDLEEKNIAADHDAEIKSVYSAGATNIRDTRITIDLFLKDKKGKEYFIEMKGPDPNKKEVRAAKEDLLNVIAMKKREISIKSFDKKVRVIFGVYYNNEDGDYNNWKVSPMFERGQDLLVQEEFWDLLGGKGTYKELLNILEQVKEKVFPIIEKTINKF
ncbi:TdeIII family type II restriction endonuclease [Candidatus Woesearchaeota archaeon]|nr:TdeIII family type II restriction endonuclease [Candidatus Woesearchaeota archaeon]